MITAVIQTIMRPFAKHTTSACAILITTLFVLFVLPTFALETTDVERVRLSIGIRGSGAFVLVDRESNGSTIYRKLVADKDHSSFTRFRHFVNENKKLDDAIQDLIRNVDTGRRGHSWHGPELIVEVVGRHGTKRYIYDGIREAYFSDAWETLEDNDPDAFNLFKKEMGTELWSVSQLILALDDEDAKIWQGEKCDVVVYGIKGGANKHSNWDFELPFPDNIEPKEMRFSIDWTERLSSKPYGIVNLGNYNGFYDLLPTIKHPE